MKRTTTTMRKLHLKRETIRTLDALRILAATELAAVNGGLMLVTSAGDDTACGNSGRITC